MSDPLQPIIDVASLFPGARTVHVALPARVFDPIFHAAYGKPAEGVSRKVFEHTTIHGQTVRVTRGVRR